MFFKLQSYLQFLFKSIFQKKIATKFISEFKNNCFNLSKNKDKLTIFKNYKTQLLRNKNTIKVRDFGAGSTIFSSDERQISKIAQVAGISNKNASILINSIDFLKPKNILEIGTSLGLATAALAIKNPNSTIFTLEGCPETAKIAQQQFDAFNFENINLTVGDFSETLPKTIKNKQFDFIYFDGNHQKKATLEYFNMCLTSAKENSIFIFDDIHWSKEMEEAWEIIKQNTKVTSTINTYQWGIVFFNNQLTKQHYTIRV